MEEKENGSMMITTNRNFEDVSTLFSYKATAPAIIGRIVHHAAIIKLSGTSYHVKNLIEQPDLFGDEIVNRKALKAADPGTQIKRIRMLNKKLKIPDLFDISGGLLSNTYIILILKFDIYI